MLLLLLRLLLLNELLRVRRVRMLSGGTACNKEADKTRLERQQSARTAR